LSASREEKKKTERKEERTTNFSVKEIIRHRDGIADHQSAGGRERIRNAFWDIDGNKFFFISS